MQSITTLTTREGKTITHKGTSGMTITATRTGNNVNVEMEFDVASEPEAIAMIGTLLVQLEDIHGENFIALCIAQYAKETGKVQQRPGKPDIAVMRARQKK